MRSSRGYRNVYSSEKAAVSSQGDGCSIGLLLPPLVVVIVGCLLASVVLTSASASTTIDSAYTQNNISFPDNVTGENADDIILATTQDELATLSDTTSQVNPEGTTLSSEGLIEQQNLVSPTQPPDDNIGLSTVFTPEVQYWAREIRAWSEEAGLDPNLVAVVMQIESCGAPMALSRSGAMGLFQVMPFHFYNSDNPYDPETNAVRGLSYLRRSLNTSNGDIRLALAGYNGGISVIGRDESTWKDETLRYIYWGTGIYSDATGGAVDSSRLQEWLAAGGSSLCQQARKRLGMSQ